MQKKRWTELCKTVVTFKTQPDQQQQGHCSNQGYRFKSRVLSVLEYFETTQGINTMLINQLSSLSHVL